MTKKKKKLIIIISLIIVVITVILIAKFIIEKKEIEEQMQLEYAQNVEEALLLRWHMSNFDLNAKLSTGEIMYPLAFSEEEWYQFIKDVDNKSLTLLAGGATQKVIDKVNREITTDITLDDVLLRPYYVIDIINKEIPSEHDQDFIFGPFSE